MIAHQHHQRRELGQVADAVGELALIGRVGVAGLEGVAREDGQVNLVLAGVLDHLVHAPQKIADAAAQPGLRVGAPVILHADVNVGEVQHADRFHITAFNWQPFASTLPQNGCAEYRLLTSSPG